MSLIQAKLLWICLAILTTALIWWPVSPSPFDPLPVQSIHAINNLPWFSALFYAWAVVLAALLFLRKGGILEHLGLCLVFTLVFVGFSGLASPWGNSLDSALRIAEVNIILESGGIPAAGHPELLYFDFPGLHLVDLALLQSTGLDLFAATRVYLLASGLIFTVILYAAFLKLLKEPLKAALGVVLAFSSSMVLGGWAYHFHPINLATIYIGTFVLLMATQDTEQPFMSWKNACLSRRRRLLWLDVICDGDPALMFALDDVFDGSVCLFIERSAQCQLLFECQGQRPDSVHSIAERHLLQGLQRLALDNSQRFEMPDLHGFQVFQSTLINGAVRLDLYLAETVLPVLLGGALDHGPLANAIVVGHRLVGPAVTKTDVAFKCIRWNSVRHAYVPASAMLS